MLKAGPVLKVAGKLAWVAGCGLLLFGGYVAPSVPGTAYVLVQALTVAVLAELQYFGLRRFAPQPAW